MGEGDSPIFVAYRRKNRDSPLVSSWEARRTRPPGAAAFRMVAAAAPMGILLPGGGTPCAIVLAPPPCRARALLPSCHTRHTARTHRKARRKPGFHSSYLHMSRGGTNRGSIGTPWFPPREPLSPTKSVFASLLQSPVQRSLASRSSSLPTLQHGRRCANATRIFWATKSLYFHYTTRKCELELPGRTLPPEKT